MARSSPANLAGTLTRAAGDGVGTYAVQQGTLTAGSNYNLTFLPGTLKIVHAPAGVLCYGAPGRTVLPPINPDGSSVFKQGSTVPAKLRVCDAHGMSIGTVGVITDFKLIQTNNGTVSSVNEPVDSTTPDTAFRWSAVDQQWIFNISSKGLRANTTYTYQLWLNDGTSFTFRFGLK